MTWLIDPLIPIDLRLDLFAIIFVSFGDKTVKGISEVLWSCRRLIKLLDESLHEFLEVLFSNYRLELMEHLKSFLILHTWLCLIWVNSAHVLMKGSKRTMLAKVLDRLLQVEALHERFCHGFIFTQHFLSNLPLNENSKTFINPKVFPGLASNKITCPGMCHLMNSCVNLRFISSDHSRRNETQQWILHSSKWECWRQHKDIVLSPSIWNANPFFNLV